MGLFKKLFGNKKKAEEEALREAVPDKPLPFGYKCIWLCIKSEGPEDVMEKLGAKDILPSNWYNGLNNAGQNGKIFVSPCLDGYVLVIGLDEESPDGFKKLAAGFEEFQAFGSHRVVSYSMWARFVNGELVRGYSFVGDRGEAEWDEGEMTGEEKKLGFDKYPIKDGEIDWENAEFPDEDSVTDIAAAWGIDPLFRNSDYPCAMGYLCKI